MTVMRFRAYGWPSGEVGVWVRGTYYGLGLYVGTGRMWGVHVRRHGIIAPGFDVIWRRYVPPS